MGRTTEFAPRDSYLPKVSTEKDSRTEPRDELPDEWWYRVYAAVIITTLVVVLALWAFTEFFS